MTAVVHDIRVHRMMEKVDLVQAAARASVKFIRRQCEATQPADKDELVKRMWRLYFKLKKGGLLSAPKTTGQLMRDKYGSHRVVGLTLPAA